VQSFIEEMRSCQGIKKKIKYGKVIWGERGENKVRGKGIRRDIC
jgi:hypothetical protein